MEPEAGSRSVSLDLELVDALLARARDLAEIKLVLQVARLAAASGSPRVALEQLIAPENVRAVVGVSSPEPTQMRLERVVEQAVANGLLHRMSVRGSADAQIFLLLATPRNDRIIGALREGRNGAETELDLPDAGEVLIHRPNVFSLYEHHIGPLTPLIAEHLREAERAYPREWLEQAMLQAEEYNARTWRYVETILQRWEAEGGPTLALR